VRRTPSQREIKARVNQQVKPPDLPTSKNPPKSTAGERKTVESVNRLLISYGGGPGQGARDGGTERKGPLSTAAISRAGARRSPDIVSKVRPDADETLRIVLARLDDMKAEDTTTIDLRNESAFTDYMVVTSGRSNRHVGSVADRVLEDLREAGLTGLRVEGMPHCDWVLIDAGDVIVHVFRPEVRAFYNLEKMWSRGRTSTRQAS
jgi:ribosome-associated protein